MGEGEGEREGRDVIEAYFAAMRNTRVRLSSMPA